MAQISQKIAEVYFDNAATTKVSDVAVRAAISAMRQHYGNPSSLHKKGFVAETIVKNARQTVASCLGCGAKEIFFTSGATEANNVAILGAALANKRRGNKIITTTIEHASVVGCMSYLQAKGFAIAEIAPRAGQHFCVEDVANEVDENTVLVSLMQVNNETGLILPVEQIAKAVKQKNSHTIVHVDGVQSFLKLPLKLRGGAIDLFCASGHKVSAPKGIGFLYKNEKVKVTPLHFGGNSQNPFHPGTESVPLIAAFAAAIEQKCTNINARYDYTKSLSSCLLEKLESLKTVQVNAAKERSPYILNVSAVGIRSEVMMHFLAQHDIFVSSGSACAKGAKSRVLTAMGLPGSHVDSALRISFCSDNHTGEIDRFVSVLSEGISTLQKA